MILGLIIFTAVLAALLVYKYWNTITDNIHTVFKLIGYLLVVTISGTIVYLENEKGVDIGADIFGMSLESQGVFMFVIVFGFLMFIVVEAINNPLNQTLATRIKKHNKKIEEIRDDLELVKKQRAEFEKEIKLSDKLYRFSEEINWTFRGLRRHILDGQSDSWVGTVFNFSDFSLTSLDNTHEYRSATAISYKFEHLTFDEEVTPHLLNFIYVERDLVEVSILIKGDCVFKVLFEESRSQHNLVYSLVAFKPSNWTIYLIKKLDDFFEEIKVLKETQKEFREKELKEWRDKENFKKQEQIKKDFL